MDDITIIVDGKPVAKGRHRIGRLANGRPMAFTPAKTRSYEDVLRLAAGVEMIGRSPLTGPVEVCVGAILPVPKSFSKKKTAAALSGELLPVTKPDVDNYAKAALDALNTIVFGDDSQVVQLISVKRYGTKPRLEINVRPFVLDYSIHCLAPKGVAA